MFLSGRCKEELLQWRKENCVGICVSCHPSEPTGSKRKKERNEERREEVSQC